MLENEFSADTAAVPVHKKGIGCGGWLAIIAFIAFILVVILTVTNDRSSTTSQSSSTSDPQNTVPPEKSAEQSRDDAMTEQGWAVAVSGDTYYRFLTDEERADASCGHWTCTWVVLRSESGCSGGFYVKGDIVSGETPVGWTNEVSASAKPGENVVVQLEDHQGLGDAFRVSEINCLS